MVARHGPGSEAIGFAVRARPLLLWLMRTAMVMLGVLIVIVALLTLGARAGLPFVADYKSDVEALLGDSLGRPVSIHSMSLAWHGRGPVLNAAGVSVGQANEQGITLQAALIDLHAFASLWRRKPVLNELTLVGADLQLVRERNGRYALQGLDDRPDPGIEPASDEGEPGASAALPALGWLFDATRVGLIDSRLSFTDRRTDRRLVFTDVSIVAHNDTDLHRLRIGVDLPDTLGERAELGIDLQPLSARATRQTLTGDWQLRANRLAVAPLLALLDEQGVLPAGTRPEGGDARLSAELSGVLEKGRSTRWQGRLELDGFRAANGRPDTTLPDALSVPVSARLGPAGDWQLRADGAELVGNRQRLRIPRLRVRIEPDEPGGPDEQPLRWQLHAAGARPDAAQPGAPLELLTGLAALLPASIAPAAFQWLDAAAPRGEVRGWRLALDASAQGVDPSSAATLTFDADIAGFRARAVDDAPGVDALDLTLHVADGRARVGVQPARAGGNAGRAVRIDTPTRRSRPMLLSALDLDLTLERLPHSGWRASGPVALASGTFEADARVTVTADGRGSPLIDVHGGFALGDAREVADLLPDRLLGDAVTGWFRDALQAGSASDGQLLVLGRVEDFPFDGGEGVFKATAQIDGLDLAWLEEWPAARGLAGQAAVNGASVSARANRGAVGEMPIDSATLSIDDLRSPRLRLVASGAASAPAMLDFATAGPLASLLGPALEGTTGDGSVGMDLRVAAPLSDAAARLGGPLRVDGTLFFAGNRLSFGQTDIELMAVNGGLSFDQDGARMNRVQAEWLGRPVRLDAVTQGQGAERAMTLSVDGVLAANEVVEHFGLPLDRWLRGTSRWRTTLGVPFDEARLARDGVTLSVASDLVGTALLLPAPLDKRASESTAFELRTAFVPDEPVVRWRASQRSERLPDVEVLADVAGEELLSLAIGLGGRDADPTGRPGVRLDGAVSTLDADGWTEALATLIEDIESSSVTDPAAPDTAILPVSGDLRVERLSLRRAPLDAARLQIDTDPRYLNVVLDNPLLSGTLRYPRRRTTLAGQPLALTARLKRVDERVVDALLGESEEPVEVDPDEPAGGPDPRALPPIEAQIASLSWGKLDLKDVTLRTEPRRAGLAVTAIGFTHQHLQLFGEGRWQLVDPARYDARGDGKHRSELALTVQSSDFESGLRDIGLTGLLGGTAGRATATIGWPGPLWSPDLGALNGELELALQQGRVVPLEPGAGRLIGLFALQTLPRRLSLDFSDLTDDGLAFTTLDGRATMEDGVLDTSLLQLTGPVGVIDVIGRTDLVAQTLDQQITVLPRVSAALPIIGMIGGGATAGVGVLIAGGLLKALGVDFDRIGLREYRLDGPWAEPRLTPVSTFR